MQNAKKGEEGSELRGGYLVEKGKGQKEEDRVSLANKKKAPLSLKAQEIHRKRFTSLLFGSEALNGKQNKSQISHSSSGHGRLERENNNEGENRKEAC